MCDRTEGQVGGFSLKESSRDQTIGGSVAGFSYARHEQPNTAARDGGGLLTLGNVADAFEYHPWGPDQREAGEIVREALVAAAKAILRSVPQGPSRTRALNHLIDARMIANAAITHRGRF